MAPKQYSGSIIMLRCFTPTEKAELDAWADKHDKPTGPFLLSKLRDLKDAEEHKRPAYQNREHELRAEIVALQTELRLAKAALQRAEILRAVPTSGLRDLYLARQIKAVLEGQGTMKEDIIFSLLEIEESDRVIQDVVRQELEALEGDGWVRKNIRGWRWIG
jgi:hypothetical protein